MERIIKIVACSLVIGLFLIVVVCCLILFYFGGDSSKNLERLHRKTIQKEVVAKINEYIGKTGQPPQTLSEIGLEQTVSAFIRDDMVFYLIPGESPNYVLECWDKDNIESQYVSEENRWLNEPDLYEFEPPINVDTVWNIYRIVALKDRAVVQVDSSQINTVIYPIIDCYNVKPDSIALLSYYYPDGELMMHGWVAYHTPFAASHYDKEFGEWKYYDGKGNCYRKFWNYKKEGKLIYETDR